MYKLIITIFLSTLLPIRVDCQTGQKEKFYYSHINYTTQNGLPSNETHCIIQDHNGFIWIGTDRGLVRYDGYEFEIFTQADGITENVIFHISEDKTGRLWFATLNNKIFSYREDEGFQTNLDYDLIDSILSEQNFIGEDFYIDSMNNIILTQHMLKGRKMLIIKSNKQAKLFNYTEEEKYARVRINDVEFIGRFAEEQLSNNEFLEIKCKLLNKKSLSGGQGGFCDVLLENESDYLVNQIFKEHIFIANENNELLEYKNINVFALGNHYVVQDSIGPEWNAKIVFNKKNYLDKDHKKTHFLIDGYRITGSLEDANGGIWLSTLYSGVLYFPNLKSKTSKIPYNIKAINLGEKIGFFSKDEKQFEMNYGMENELEAKESNSFDISSNIDLAFDNSFRYNDRTLIDLSSIYNITPRVLGYQKLNANDFIYWSSYYVDEISEKGIKRICGRFSRITSVIALSDSTYLTGHLDGLYNLENNELHRSKFDFGIINDRIQDLKYDCTNNLLYVATMGNGLYVIKGEKLIQHFRKQDGLSSNTINQLFIDDNARLWIATNSGLNYYDYAKKESGINQIYAPTELVGSNNVTQVRVVDSVIYMATDFGINLLDQTQIEDKKHDVFPIHLRDLWLSGEKVSFDSINQSHLSHKQNNIEIHFKAISFKKFGDITYRYRLMGLDSTWIVTKDTRAVFLSIPPGQYHFELQALNENGTWLNSYENLNFRIDKAFWRKGWFYLIISLIIGIVILFGFWAYYNSMKKRERLSAEINRANQLALTSQLNPHFVFNSLNSIQNFILKKDREKSNEYLGQFSKLMREIFENSKELYIPVRKELTAVKNYLELEKLRYNQFFSYTIYISDNINTAECLLPSLIVQPLVENAILHGIMHRESGKGILRIEVLGDEDSLIIKVFDNGVGRNKSKKRSSIFSKHVSGGLNLTRQRLSLLQKEIKKPTSITFEDLKNNEGQIIGTKVELIIPKILIKI